jgi:5-methylthioribose kinase
MEGTLLYRALSEQEAVEYVSKLPGLFPESASLVSREIGDGNLNMVFHVQDTESGKSVIVKQALPYIRVVKDWPMTLDRARIEVEVLREQDKHDPGRVPKVYHYDADLALFVMEDLSDYTIMRKGLIDRTRYPQFAEHAGRFLARTLFSTSDYALSAEEKKALNVRFSNPELCKLTENVVFTDPYRDLPHNRYNPLIQAEATALWTDDELKLEVAKLKEKFLTHAQALVHGDFHTGSIFVTEADTKVIDPEFAFYGPMGFDIGALYANLLLNYAAQIGHSPNAAERDDYRAHLIGIIRDSWRVFEQEFRRLWTTISVEPTAHAAGYLDYYLHNVLQDTSGFAGAKMIRRIVGIAHVADIDSIEDDVVRAEAEKLGLAIGRKLIVNRTQVKSIEDLINLAIG